MKIKTKTLFKLWGGIWWLGERDEKSYFFIPKNEKSERWFKWAPDEKTVTGLFKREVQKYLQEKLRLKYPPKFYHIWFNLGATIEKLKSKKVSVQKQLKLFKKRSQ